VTRSEIAEALGPIGVFLNAIGIPTGLLLLVVTGGGYMIWSGVSALHETVLVPYVEANAEYLKQTSATLQSLGETQRRQSDTLQEIAVGQRDIHQALQRLGSVESGTRPPR